MAETFFDSPLIVETSPAGPAFPPLPNLPGIDQILAKAGGAVRNEAKIQQLANYTQIQLAGSEIFKSLGLPPAALDPLRALLAMDEVLRMQLCQQVIGLAKGLGSTTKFDPITDASLDELRTARNMKRGVSVTRLMRVNVLERLLTLGASASGNICYADVVFEEGKAYARVRYGPVKGDSIGESIAEMRWAIDPGCNTDFVGVDNFVKALNADGHRVSSCIGTADFDFIVMLFVAAYAGKWVGNEKRMVFSKRPGVEKLKIVYRGAIIPLMDPERSTFSPILLSMHRSLSNLFVPADPVDHLGFIWEQTRGEALNARAYSALIQDLPRVWDTMFKESLIDLERDLIASYMMMGKEPLYGTLSPVGFFHAISELESARAYRGKTDGEGLSAALNTHMKVVGTDALGVIASSFLDITRHQGLLAAAAASDAAKIVLYTNERKLDIEPWARSLGKELIIYSDAKNTAHTPRDFLTEGPHVHGNDTFVIVDIYTEGQNPPGMNTTVAGWNQQARVLDALTKSVTPARGCIFTRMFGAKKGKDSYDVDADLMVAKYVKLGNVGASFLGCRAHNGEFVLAWNKSVSSPNPVVRTVNASSPGMNKFMEVLVQVVCGRIVLANQMRTWATPLGRWSWARKATPAGASQLECLRIRQIAGIRAVKSETRSISTAATFGQEKKVILSSDEMKELFGVEV